MPLVTTPPGSLAAETTSPPGHMQNEKADLPEGRWTASL